MIKEIELSKVCDIRSGGTPSRTMKSYYGGQIPWAKIGDLEANESVTATQEYISEEGLRAIRGRVFPTGTLLFAIYGSMGKMAFAGTELATNQAILGIQPRAHNQINLRYLYHYLSQRIVEMQADGRGVTQKNLSATYLRELKVPLPQFDTQNRIAMILDKAEAIKRKHEHVLALGDDLLKSAFQDMFGDSETNPKRYKVRTLGSLIEIPLRNGISPSSRGQIEAEVLTLSAITGKTFDPSQRKVGKFLVRISDKDEVSHNDFYICRGNGSTDLVGRGSFAPATMPGVAFPDTMIAARPRPSDISRGFLETIWNSKFVRSQIVNAARTTNGTFKINQTATENISFPLPPLEEQMRYEELVSKVRSIRDCILSSSLGDQLFGALSQRAFRGEL